MFVLKRISILVGDLYPLEAEFLSVNFSFMKFILHWFLSALAIIITTYLINKLFTGSVSVDPWWVTLVVALVLGVVNTLVRPLMLVLTLPVTILTLGVSILFINGLMIMLVSWLVPGFEIASFLAGFVFALILSVTNWLLHKIA